MVDNNEIPAITSFLADSNFIHIVDYLYALDESRCHIDDIVDHTHARTGEDPEQVRVDLVHNHLPRLADQGVITYDPATQIVQLDNEAVIKGLHKKLSR